jgi:hypothetical protein
MTGEADEIFAEDEAVLIGKPSALLEAGRPRSSRSMKAHWTMMPRQRLSNHQYRATGK